MTIKQKKSRWEHNSRLGDKENKFKRMYGVLFKYFICLKKLKYMAMIIENTVKHKLELNMFEKKAAVVLDKAYISTRKKKLHE